MPTAWQAGAGQGGGSGGNQVLRIPALEEIKLGTITRLQHMKGHWRASTKCQAREGEEGPTAGEGGELEGSHRTWETSNLNKEPKMHEQTGCMRREGIPEEGGSTAKARKHGRKKRFKEGQVVHVTGEQGLQRCEKDLVQRMPLEMEERVGPVMLRNPAGHGYLGFPNRGCQIWPQPACIAIVSLMPSHAHSFTYSPGVLVLEL